MSYNGKYNGRPSSSRRSPSPPRRPIDSGELQALTCFGVNSSRYTHGTAFSGNSASSSTDRKRRHADSSPERHGYPYVAYAPTAPMIGRRPSGLSMGSIPGSSRDNTIDLTSPSPPPPRQQPMQRSLISQQINGNNASTGPARSGIRVVTSGGSFGGNIAAPGRENDVVLPTWQPDGDVDKCPICDNDFHFFYRKHHCRKCGRVVCAACSPHRITIPKQYIVQPPTSSDGEQPPASPVSGASEARNLGGGEVVRVCNPCVPDPWMPNVAAGGQQRPTEDDAQISTIHGAIPIPTRHRFPSNAAQRARTHSNQGLSNPFNLANNPGETVIHRDPYSRPPHSHRYTQSSNAAPFPMMPPGQMPQPVPPPPQQQQVLRPRREAREVAEEDECPVCGTELPPGENVREAHIQECIVSRFWTSPSSSSLPTYPAAMPPPRTSSIPAANQTTTASMAASIARPLPALPGPLPGSRPRATSYRPRGMAIYRATEKDCTTEEGEPQECVICFEEFQPGDEMGRMECLCKFHRVCIRRWWDTKGTGSCPTHQLHD